MNTRLLFAPLLVSALAFGCEDPAKGKVKAQTGEAQQASTAAPSAGAKTYRFDAASGSKLDWVGAKVTRKHEGTFKSFNGAIQVDPAAPEKGKVDVEIETASLYTADGDRLLNHLKSADFFDVATYPKATFASTDVKKAGEDWTITGNLTLHGVTKSITFPAKVKVGDAGVDADAEFAINRKDFGMAYPGAADDLIRDDVVIKLSIHSKASS